MSESDDQPERQAPAPTKVFADLTEDADTATGERVRQTPKPRRIKGTTAREDRAARKRMAEIKQWVLRVRARYPRQT
jgi:hypothetical protein